ncbi:MAG: hypothetical protein ACK4YQ_10515 [Phenylobacterium sp.]|uniref:hypothetical protein n=1 Tax=Phenylobacterium sp. TaxID=1871053 RepID=UPI003919E778
MAPQHNGARGRATAWAVRLLGAVLGLIGLVLTAGGAWLALVGGSLYYLLAGLALVASGVLLILRNPLGAWTYFILYGVTLAWAVWESGLDGWGLLPRVVAPSVLMVLVLLATPALTTARPHRVGALGVAAAFVVVLLGGGLMVAVAQPEMDPRPLPPATLAMSEPSPMQPGADWPAYGGAYSARRYSPLSQITPQNVDGLERVWLAHTGDLPSETAKGMYAAETTPLKVGDSLYLCSAKNILIALDAGTGKERWRYDPRVPDAWIPYSASCRGVSYYAAPGAELAVRSPLKDLRPGRVQLTGLTAGDPYPAARGPS